MNQIKSESNYRPTDRTVCNYSFPERIKPRNQYLRPFTLLGLLLFLGTVGLGFGQDRYTGPHAAQQFQFGDLPTPPDKEMEAEGPTEPLRARRVQPDHVVFGYHPYWSGTAYQNYNYSLLTHIAFFSAEITSHGYISDDHGWPVTSLINLAHSHGVKVILTATLFNSSDIATLLSSSTYRQNAINSLLSRVQAANADGVNIDFEMVPSGQESNFNTFIHDLTQAFHSQIPGSEVSIAMPAVDWWDSYDYGYLNDNCDYLMIMGYDYFWGGSDHAGPVAPLNSGFSSWYIQRTVEDYLSETGGDGSKIILGLPWYGIDWPVVNSAMGAATTGSGSAVFYASAEAAAQSFGKLYNSQAPSAWYRYTSSGSWHQAWYDDSTSLAAKYSYAVETGLAGVGIWALGYDGGRQEMWGALYDILGGGGPPLPPSWFYVRNIGNNQLLIQFPAVAHADSYKVYLSTDAVSFTAYRESAVPLFVLDSLESGTLYYFKLRSVNREGMSDFTEVLGGVPTMGTAPILIVNGFERVSGTNNTFDYIKRHGPPIAALGFAFDAASNDAVEAGIVDLNQYSLVDWISGEEATATVSFSQTEQEALMNYLNNGGRLFVSGSEIGWDLVANGSQADIDFYHNYLKADYIVDDAGVYTVHPTANGIFNGLADMNFDNGSHGSYDVDYPEGIKPRGGAVSNLRYSGVDYNSVGGAGIQYLGPFNGGEIGGVVYLGVGLEAFYPASARQAIMERVLNYLMPGTNVADTPQPQDFHLLQVFPNPFNSQLQIKLRVQPSSKITIRIFDLKGREVQRQELTARTNLLSWTWSPDNLASGVYLLEARDHYNRSLVKVSYVK